MRKLQKDFLRVNLNSRRKMVIAIILVSISMYLSVFLIKFPSGSKDEDEHKSLQSGAKQITHVTEQTILHQEIEMPSGKLENFPIIIPGTSSSVVVSLIAPSPIESELVSPTGVVVDRIVANSEEANAPFEDLSVDNPVAGTWILRLMNKGMDTALILVTAGYKKQ